jgi:Tfp pilus assembly pilus retraction ATPase PilT
MSLMPSLCAALERAGGDRLVMRAGERPHVLTGKRRHDVASAVLSVSAVEALAEQILSSAARHELAASGSVSEPVTSTLFPRPLSARAERVGDDFCIELMVSMTPVEAPAPVEEVVSSAQPGSEVTCSAPKSYYAAPVSEATPEQTVHGEPVPTYAEDPASVEQPEVVALTEPAPVASEPEPVAPHVPEPVASYVLEPLPVPLPPPAAEIAVESSRRVRSEPVQHQEVTVVTRVEKPVRAPRPVASVTAALDLLDWIGHAADLGATTLYLRAGSPAAARIDERIQPISQETVAVSVIEDTTAAFTRGGDGVWEARADGEWVREDDELGYISCRVFSDQQGSGLIFHLRPSTSLRLLHKHIPRQVRTACEGNGLVVVAASNEADVEALAAAVADWSGRDRGGYLISLQRRSRSHGEIAGAFVSQRTIAGTDKDFAAAIRRAAQESPDILLVTGLQAEQPLQAAVLAATSGRLVIAGVVAPTTVEALRMLAGSDTHVRRATAASFRAAIGYRSLRRLGGGRTLIQDVVLASGSVCSLIESGDFSGFGPTQNDVAAKMKSVDEALARAVTRRQISLREAARQAIDRSHLVALVRSQARTTSSGTLALAGGRDVRPADTQTADHRIASGFSRY